MCLIQFIQHLLGTDLALSKRESDESIDMEREVCTASHFSMVIRAVIAEGRGEGKGRHLHETGSHAPLLKKLVHRQHSDGQLGRSRAHRSNPKELCRHAEAGMGLVLGCTESIPRKNTVVYGHINNLLS